MSLYRILLADDEEEVRKGIIRKINWEQAGFEVAGDAENGQDALEKIEQLKPDVAMIDIRMPYMDGLELSEKIRQRYPSMKILIFSGYDDFEYAKQAIKLKVTEYILKPVNVEELTEILNRVRESLDEEIRQRRNISLLRESYEKSLPVLRELFLNDMVHGAAPKEIIEPRLKEFGVDISGARKWVAAVLHTENGEKTDQAGKQPLAFDEQRELIPISVRQMAEDKLKGYFRAVVFNSVSGITVIAALDEENTMTRFMDLLGDLCKEVQRILEVTVTAGVGYGSLSLEEMDKSYQSAVDALGYKAIVGAGNVIYINDVEPVSRGKLELDGKDEEELRTAIKFGTPAVIETVVQKLTGRMDDARVHTKQYQIYIFSLVNCMIQLFQQQDMDFEQIFEAEGDYMAFLSNAEKRGGFAGWMLRVACRANEMMSRKRDTAARQVILDAKRYIRENHSNPNLSVEMVCRELHMSPAYFSTMFRKETGQTYINYLTEIRLNRAVELLNTTTDKTYMIAQKVGYQEPNYFSYVFKKRFGVSPTKFRGPGE